MKFCDYDEDISCGARICEGCLIADEARKEKLLAHFEDVKKFTAEGYAGCLSNGNIVDRRKHPEAIPVQKNSLLNVPEPKEVIVQ